MAKAGELPVAAVLTYLAATPTPATVIAVALGTGIEETKTRITVKHLTGRGCTELVCTTDGGVRCYAITTEGRDWLTTHTNEEN